MANNQDYIIGFSNYLVLGFIRIENLYALFVKSRAYDKYMKIPQIFQNYIKSAGNDDGKNKLQNEFDTLIKVKNQNMYDYILENMPEKSNKDGNSLDKLSDIIKQYYKIETNDKLFSSVVNNTANSDNSIDEDIQKKIIEFLKQYELLNKRLKAPTINDHVERDITICMLISATEFTNALHHIYISYYVCNFEDEKYYENIKKAIKHLERAILDIKESLNLSNQQNIKHAHIKQRLDKIYNVGQV